MKTLIFALLLSSVSVSAETITVACDDLKSAPLDAIQSLEEGQRDLVPVFVEMTTNGWDGSSVSSWAVYFEGSTVGKSEKKGTITIRDGEYIFRGIGQKGYETLTLSELNCTKKKNVKKSSAKAVQTLVAATWGGTKNNSLGCKCISE